jgi:hypothetical protein
MSQPLQSINLVAPAFKGVNTEDSPLAQDPSFAEIADNAIIDKRGRLGARKGINVLTTDATELGSDRIHSIHYFYDSAGNNKLFSTGNNKILSGIGTLADETPATYSITDNNWKIVNFNDGAYFFQRGYEPLVYTNALGAVTKMSSVAGASVSSAQYCHEALAAFGRLWCVGTATDNNTIYWSDLLIGSDWTGGSSGSINVEKAWPDGFDEVRALAAHNNSLIIFGRHSILVYGGANSPATMALTDTVAGLGCICRNSVQYIGTDVLFMSENGLRSLGRAIQEKALPISDLSRNIQSQLTALIANRAAPTASVYSPENSFYLITFPAENTTLCFDLRGRLENGAYRATVWPGSKFEAWERKPTDGTLYTGTTSGIGEYDTYLDEGESYRFKYVSPGLTFGDPSKTKFLKKIRPTIVGGGTETVFVKWSYDLDENYKSASFALGSDTSSIAFYNQGAEFNIAEFSGGTSITRKSINATSGGSIITVGIETEMNGSEVSIQEINVLALMGKTL